VEEGPFIANDFSAEDDVEILKGNSEQVGAMEKAQRLDGWFARAGVGDAMQIAT